MGTIADKLTYLNDTKQDIKSAIIEKGQVVSDGDTFRSYADKIRAIETGTSPSATSKAINFYDYDGTLLYSYTVDEFAKVTELPSPPTHDRLTFQGWNWSIEDIKAMGRAVNVGATYVTSSGKSEFDLTVNSVTTLAVAMRFYNVTAGNMITVDWGDGTSDNAPSTAEGVQVFTHTYSAAGDYTATVDSTGAYYLYGEVGSPNNMFNVAPSYICTTARLGVRCTSINNYAFHQCFSLKSVTIPNGITTINNYTFATCRKLKSVTIPDSVASLGGYVFRYCYSLKIVTIPNSITTLTGTLFAANYSLESITIPDSITSINADALSACYSLKSVTIPSGVTNIGGSSFAANYNLEKYKMLRTTPPSLSSANAFNDINKICIIEVPKGSLSAYQTATSWSTYAAYMVESAE